MEKNYCEKSYYKLQDFRQQIRDVEVFIKCLRRLKSRQAYGLRPDWLTTEEGDSIAWKLEPSVVRAYEAFYEKLNECYRELAKKPVNWSSAISAISWAARFVDPEGWMAQGCGQPAYRIDIFIPPRFLQAILTEPAH